MCVVHVMSVLSVLQWREGGTERVCVCCACNERSVCYSGGREVRREFVCVVHVMSVLSVLQWREGGTERVCVCSACNERSVCVTVA